MFTNKRMAKQIVVYSYNRILVSSIEKNEVLIHTQTWMSLQLYVVWKNSIVLWNIVWFVLWLSGVGKTHLGDSRSEEGLPMGVEKWLQGKVRELWGIIEMFCILIRVLGTGVYAIANTYPIVHLVSVHFTLGTFYGDFPNRM